MKIHPSMRIQFILRTLLALLFSITLNSCSSDDDNSGVDDGTSQLIVQGSWRITYFFEDNIDQTHYFTGYAFIFSADHTLSAVNGDVTILGNWTIGNDDSTHKLVILFPIKDGPFEEISEDWQIQNKTPSKIELKHQSGGSGSVDFLTFEKI